MPLLDRVCPISVPRQGVLPGQEEESIDVQAEESRWYVVRVNARHEKSVSRMLSLLSYTNFLPLTRKTHSYGARLREYDIPVFPGYVFCHLAPGNTWFVQQLPSILEIVGVRGKPSIVPDAEIQSLRLAAACRMPLHPWPYSEAGDKVRITDGPLAGVTGVLLDRTAARTRVVLSVNLLRRSVLLHVDRVVVERVPGSQ
jgi:transcription antitermination factor NusG